jgi:hypothetical protein
MFNEFMKLMILPFLIVLVILTCSCEKKQNSVKDYNFICYDKCENTVGGVSMDTIKKYGIKRNLQPFDIKQTESKDTISVNFKFISNCCLNYLGDVLVSGDTVNLTYKDNTFSPCDCQCIYNYEFRLPINGYQSKNIVLGDSLISKR